MNRRRLVQYLILDAATYLRLMAMKHPQDYPLIEVDIAARMITSIAGRTQSDMLILFLAIFGAGVVTGMALAGAF